MSSVSAALDRFRRSPSPAELGAISPFKLVSSIDKRATEAELEHIDAPELVELWLYCRSARLFEDVEYGQWGLVLLDAGSALDRTKRERTGRATNIYPDDVVIGEFLGDQDLLIFAPSEAGTRRILVALPLDDRADWHPAGTDLGGFLERYFNANGEKFWEVIDDAGP